MSPLRQQVREQYREAIRRISDGAAYREWQIAQDREAMKMALGALRRQPSIVSQPRERA